MVFSTIFISAVGLSVFVNADQQIMDNRYDLASYSGPTVSQDMPKDLFNQASSQEYGLPKDLFNQASSQEFNVYNKNDYVIPQPQYNINYGGILSSQDTTSCACDDEINELDQKLSNLLSILKQKQQSSGEPQSNLYAPPVAVMDYVSHYPSNNAIPSGHNPYGSISGYNLYARKSRPQSSRDTSNEQTKDNAFNGVRTISTGDKTGFMRYTDEKNNNGHSQQNGYQGTSKWLDEQAAQEGYKKKEDYSNGGYKIDDAATHESGAKENEAVTATIRKQSSNQIDYQQNLADNFNNERHSGMYKGNEFDISMNVQDQQGGYKELENDKKYEAKKSDGFNGKSELTKTGDYNGQDYIKGNDWSNEGDYTTDTQGRPGKAYFPEGMENNSKNLYNQYQGSEQREKPNQPAYETWFDKNQKDNTNSGAGVETGEYTQDGDKREYGSAFDAKDSTNKQYANEGYAKLEQNDKTKSAFDMGSYRNVEAKGHNKFADYNGDYSTVNTDHDTKYQLKDDRQFKEDIDTDFQHNHFSDKYVDAKATGQFQHEKNGGKYYDQEQYKEYDTNAHKKAYEADSFSNGKNSEGYVDTQTKQTNTNEQSVHVSNGNNNDHYNRYGKGYVNGYY